VTHKKVCRRKTKKALSRSTHDLKGTKTPKATRGNTQDKKLTRVHDCKRGKATLLKLKPKIDYGVLVPHSEAEDANVNASQVVFDNVDQNVKPFYGGGVLQVNGSIHGRESSLQCQLPNDLGQKQASTRAEVGWNSTQCIWSDTGYEKPRRTGTQDGRVRQNKDPSKGHPRDGKRNWKGMERGSCNEADNDMISSVIQSTNQSRVPSSGPSDDVRPRGKDARSAPEHKLERKR